MNKEEEILSIFTVMQADISGLKSDLSELKIDVGELKANVLISKTKVSSLKRDVFTLNTEISGLKSGQIRIEHEFNKSSFTEDGNVAAWVKNTSEICKNNKITSYIPYLIKKTLGNFKQILKIEI